MATKAFEQTRSIRSRSALAAGKRKAVWDGPLTEVGRTKTDASVAELKEEKSLVSELIG
jgi:hypothetical protein